MTSNLNWTSLVSRQVLARYSHIRMEAKRQALESVCTKEVFTEASEQLGATPDRRSFRVLGHKIGHNAEIPVEAASA